jgi:hypothetical protein
VHPAAPCTAAKVHLNSGSGRRHASRQERAVGEERASAGREQESPLGRGRVG